MLSTDEIVRLEAVRTAARNLAPDGYVERMLTYARWVERYVETGLMPEVDFGDSPVQTRTDKLLRLEAVRAAAQALTPKGSVHSTLIFARWIDDYIRTGRMPNIESGPIRDCRETRSP